MQNSQIGTEGTLVSNDDRMPKPLSDSFPMCSTILLPWNGPISQWTDLLYWFRQRNLEILWFFAERRSRNILQQLLIVFPAVVQQSIDHIQQSVMHEYAQQWLYESAIRVERNLTFT